jgi:hypothetical protein
MAMKSDEDKPAGCGGTPIGGSLGEGLYQLDKTAQKGEHREHRTVLADLLTADFRAASFLTCRKPRETPRP